MIFLVTKFLRWKIFILGSQLKHTTRSELAEKLLFCVKIFVHICSYCHLRPICIPANIRRGVACKRFTFPPALPPPSCSSNRLQSHHGTHASQREILKLLDGGCNFDSTFTVQNGETALCWSVVSKLSSFQYYIIVLVEQPLSKQQST